MEMLRRRIGDFYVVEQIGAGGMSNVYLALNPRTREKRAIKVLAKRATASPVSYARFLREIDIIRGLSHRNIVKILDSGGLEDCYYYSMEYMRAGSLARRLTRGKMTLGEALEIFASICSGMAYAHHKGIIHRDLKPANILIGASGTPMVSDFGIAKALNGRRTTLTKSNEIMGSIAYLSPEQRLNTKHVDHRSDVYALGAILYEMVMGFPPLGKFPLPCETQPEFPRAVQAILEKCLAIHPDDRYENAGCLLKDVEGYVGQGSATPPQTAAARPCSDNSGAVERSAHKMDRIEHWLHTLRSGTTRERLAVVREMVETMNAHETKAILKLYPTEADRVRWGLIRVLGELKIVGATQLLLRELKNPYQRECAIEALGRIGAGEAFNPIRRFVIENPNSAMTALVPLARTGKQRAIKYLRQYASHEMAVLREEATRALASIRTPESLQVLNERLAEEKDERVRAALLESIRSIETGLLGARSTRDTEILSGAKPA